MPVLFSPTISAASDIYASMFNFTAGIDIADASQLLCLVAIAGAWSVWGPNAQEAHANFKPSYGWSVAATAVFSACLTVMAGGRSSPFLYFQF